MPIDGDQWKNYTNHRWSVRQKNAANSINKMPSVSVCRGKHTLILVVSGGWGRKKDAFMSALHGEGYWC